jgi:hypothetical protein
MHKQLTGDVLVNFSTSVTTEFVSVCLVRFQFFHPAFFDIASRINLRKIMTEIHTMDLSHNPTMATEIVRPFVNVNILTISPIDILKCTQ